MTAILVTPDSAVQATNRHYDLPPELFATFLGRRMKYTCGRYASDAGTLDDAQEAKLAYITDCLGIQGGEQVLDIGAGWGSLSYYLANKFGCQVTSVTPSPGQAAFLRDRPHPLVRVRQCSVYDLDDLPSRSFDAVALVGVIEHMPDHHAALRAAARPLRKGGRLYLSASCYRSQAAYREYRARAASRQVAQDIFGFADLRPFSELVEAVEDTGLSLLGIADLTADYYRTVEAWLSGVRAGRERIEYLRPGYADELITYLETTNVGWGRTTKHYALTASRCRWGHAEVLR